MGTKDDGVGFEFDRAVHRALTNAFVRQWRDNIRRDEEATRARQLVKLCTRIVRVALDRTFTGAAQ